MTTSRASSSGTIAPSSPSASVNEPSQHEKQQAALKSRAKSNRVEPNGSTIPYAAALHESRRSIFHPSLKKERRELIWGFFRTTGLITLLLWLALPIFWGSTYLLLPFLSRLTIYVVDFDTQASGNAAIVGPAFRAMASNSNAMPSSEAHLGYVIRDAASYSNGIYDAMHEVEVQKCWGTIVINANATTAWRDAVENGVATYDPQGSVALLYQGARFYSIILLYLVPFMIKNTQTALGTAAQIAQQTIFEAIEPGYAPPADLEASSTAVTTSLNTLANVPQALGTPFGYYKLDLRPQTNWAASAVFEAGDLYLVISAFHLVIWGFLSRMASGIQKKIKLRSEVLMRLAVPIFIYFWMSLWYTCIIAAFQIPFDATVGRAGFVVDWALNYCLLLSAGLALETVLCLLTITWTPFFLILWIILNITSSFQPIDLAMNFYRLLRAFPFYHHVEASKIIFFNTAPAHVLGVHFGVLIGIFALNVFCLSLAVWFERWRNERSAKKEAEKKRREARDRKEEP